MAANVTPDFASRSSLLPYVKRAINWPMYIPLISGKECTCTWAQVIKISKFIINPEGDVQTRIYNIHPKNDRYLKMEKCEKSVIDGQWQKHHGNSIEHLVK